MWGMFYVSWRTLLLVAAGMADRGIAGMWVNEARVNEAKFTPTLASVATFDTEPRYRLGETVVFHNWRDLNADELPWHRRLLHRLFGRWLEWPSEVLSTGRMVIVGITIEPGERVVYDLQDADSMAHEMGEGVVFQPRDERGRWVTRHYDA